MINSYIKEKLDSSNVKTFNEFINVIREECQKIILFSLSKTDFFDHVAFYGGTCLRIFHNLNRYSEDLDFNVISSDAQIDLGKYEKHCLNGLGAYGFNALIRTKDEYDTGEIKRRYFAIPVFDLSTEYFGKSVCNKEQNISIKVEVSTEYVENATYERKLLVSPLFASILCFDYPSLFAGKLHAILTRNWRDREKGRDFYDYIFYLSHEIKFNINYLKSKLSNSSKKNLSSLELEDIKKMLIERFNNTNFDLVKQDINAFVIDINDLDSINKDMFVMSVNLLKDASNNWNNIG